VEARQKKLPCWGRAVFDFTLGLFCAIRKADEVGFY